MMIESITFKPCKARSSVVMILTKENLWPSLENKITFKQLMIEFEDWGEFYKKKQQNIDTLRPYLSNAIWISKCLDTLACD